jgi:hypothetical protein
LIISFSRIATGNGKLCDKTAVQPGKEDIKEEGWSRIDDTQRKDPYPGFPHEKIFRAGTNIID